MLKPEALFNNRDLPYPHSQEGMRSEIGDYLHRRCNAVLERVRGGDRTKTPKSVHEWIKEIDDEISFDGGLDRATKSDDSLEEHYASR